MGQVCGRLMLPLLVSMVVFVAAAGVQAAPPCWGASSGTKVASLRVLHSCTNPAHRVGSAVTFGQSGKSYTYYIDLIENQSSTTASDDSFYAGKPQNERRGSAGVRPQSLFVGGGILDLVSDGSSPPSGEYPSTEAYFASTFSVTGVSTTDPIPAVLYVSGDTISSTFGSAISVQFSVFEFGRSSQRASPIASYWFSDDFRGTELIWQRWFEGNQESDTTNPYDPSNRVEGTIVSSKIVEVPFDLPIHYDAGSGEYYGGIYISAATRAIVVADEPNTSGVHTAMIDFHDDPQSGFHGAVLVVEPEPGVTVSFPAGGPTFVPEPSAAIANGSVLLCLLLLRRRRGGKE